MMVDPDKKNTGYDFYDDLKMPMYVWILGGLVLSFLLGLSLTTLFSVELVKSRDVTTVADYLESRLNGSSYMMGGIGDQTTLAGFKDRYNRYTFISRSLLESEVRNLCSKCYSCDDSDAREATSLTERQMNLIQRQYEALEE